MGATAEKKAKPVEVADGLRHKLIHEGAIFTVAELVQSYLNKRREYGDVKELGNTMKTAGQLQSLIVRSITEQHVAALGSTSAAFEVLCGSRRLQAALAAGITHLRCDQYAGLTEAEALDLAVTENLQRESMAPMEEAESIGAMQDAGWDVGKIADHLGKSPTWVARRANLLKLSPAVLKMHANPKLAVSQWSVATLEELAKLPAAVQDELFKKSEWLKNDDCSATEMQRHIAEYMGSLDNAPFKLDDAELYKEAGPCTLCKKRASCQAVLFEVKASKDGAVPKGDKCLDSVCFDEKRKRALTAIMDAARKETPDVKFTCSGQQERRDIEDAGVVQLENFYQYEWKAKDGPGLKPFYDLTNNKVIYGRLYSGGSSSSKAPKVKAADKSVKQRQADLLRKREVWILRQLEQELLGDKRTATREWSTFEVVQLVRCFGTNMNAETGDKDPCEGGHGYNPNRTIKAQKFKLWEEMKSKEGKQTEQDYCSSLLRSVSQVCGARLGFNGPQSNADVEEAKRQAELWGYKWPELMTKAEEAVPMPKSLAKLLEPKTAKAGPPKKTKKPVAKGKAKGKIRKAS